MTRSVLPDPVRLGQPVAARAQASSASGCRRMVHRVVFLLVAAAIMETWYLANLVVPLEVSSGSMFPSLLGPRREVVCEDCGYRFVCGVDVQPVCPRAVCPNCGFPDNDLMVQPDLPGDYVWLSRPVFQIRSPRRWEVVAFRHPENPAMVAVKRVAGLPGESIEIRDGDVYVDGRIQRKSLEQLRSMAVVVYDGNYEPKCNPALPPRWTSDSTASRWGWAKGRFARPETPEELSVDWLSYRHWSRLPGRDGAVHPGPITNRCGYNQNQPHRSETLKPVADVLLSFRLMSVAGEGRLMVMATDGREEFVVEIDPAPPRPDCVVWRNGRKLEGPQVIALFRRPGGTLIEVALFDHQFLFALDGRVVGVWHYEPGEERRSAPLRPLAIGAKRLGVEIRDVLVCRDVYYTRPVGVDARWGVAQAYRLGPDEYFVLGDNSTVSLDSRSWPGGPAVKAEYLLGKPWLVYFPARRVVWGSKSFLIPEIAGIRYIR